MALDRLDRRILDELQRHGRLSWTELGERIGLSTSPCAERVRRLERQGVILGYHAQVDPAALGLGPLLFIELTLSCQSDEVFDRTRQALRILPGVLECHLVAGGFDYLVKARVADMAAGRALLGRVLAALPVPAQARSYVALEDLKS